MKEGEKIFIRKLCNKVGQKNIKKLKKEERQELEKNEILHIGTNLKKLITVLIVGLFIGLTGGIWTGECIKPLPDSIVNLSNSAIPFLRPKVSFSFSPKPCVNDTVIFNASKSYDINGEIIKYQWDFGDGKNEFTKEAEIKHKYLKIRDYNVTLTVIDNNGGRTLKSKKIKIRNCS